MENCPSLLTIIVELDSLLLSLQSLSLIDSHNEESFSNIVGCIILFCQSYALLNRENKLVIIINLKGKSNLIFPIPIDNDMFSPTFPKLSQHILSEITKLQLNEVQSTLFENNSLSTSLSSALCIINRQKQNYDLQTRILILQFDKDRELKYNSIMNSIFRFELILFPY
jgi:hypothetical protein